MIAKTGRCASTLDDLASLVDGDREAIERHAAHLGGCDGCRDARHAAGDVAEWISAAGADYLPAGDLETRVLARLASRGKITWLHPFRGPAVESGLAGAAGSGSERQRTWRLRNVAVLLAAVLAPCAAGAAAFVWRVEARMPRVTLVQSRAYLPPPTNPFLTVAPDDADVAKVSAEVRARASGVKACYERGLKRKPDLAGEIQVLWTVTETGFVRGVALGGGTLRDPEVAGCITQLVAGWRFTPPVRGPVQVSVPFVFSPPELSNPEGHGTLDRAAVVAGMNAAKPGVGACYEKHGVPGMIALDVEIARDGSVASAEARGKFAGTPTGHCVEAAVKAARFPRSDGLKIAYPFILR